MVLIGERINCTRKPIREAVERGDTSFLQNEALSQVAAGAQILDVNGGIPGREVETLTGLIDLVQEVTDTGLCLDSADPGALEAALPRCRKKAIINSVTDESERFDALVPLARAYGSGIVALCMGEGGIPRSAADRVSVGSRLVEKLTRAGLSLADIYLDPCVIPVSTDSFQGPSLLQAISELRERFPGVKISCGLSNVSFGLPSRKLLNRVFLGMLMSHGMDAVIADPLDCELMAQLHAARALLGQDEYCTEYLEAFRGGRLLS